MMKHCIAAAVAVLALATTLGAQAATGLKTYEKVAAEITDVKRCPKAMIAHVASAEVAVNPPGLKGTFILIQDDAGATELRFGPLAARPTEEQVKGLVGKSFCASGG